MGHESSQDASELFSVWWCQDDERTDYFVCLLTLWQSTLDHNGSEKYHFSIARMLIQSFPPFSNA